MGSGVRVNGALAAALALYGGVAFTALSIITIIWLTSLFFKAEEPAVYVDVWKALVFLGMPMVLAASLFRLSWILDHLPH